MFSFLTRFSASRYDGHEIGSLYKYPHVIISSSDLYNGYGLAVYKWGTLAMGTN